MEKEKTRDGSRNRKTGTGGARKEGEKTSKGEEQGDAERI